MLMYVTNGFRGASIESQEVERATDASVWIKGSRYARRSDYHNYHETWEEARDFILKRAERRLDAVNKDQVRAANLVAAIKRMKQPEPSWLPERLLGK